MMLNPPRSAHGLRLLGKAFSAPLVGASLLLGVSLTLGACVSTDEQGEPTSAVVDSAPRKAPVARPWTQDFREPAMLIANNVYIEGPQGLLDHIATRSLDEFHSYEAKTLPEGFCQTFKVLRPEAGVELRSYLDALELVIFNELIVIEKPGRLNVLVRAQGDAYWRDPVSGKEKRSFEINLEGIIEGPK